MLQVDRRRPEDPIGKIPGHDLLFVVVAVALIACSYVYIFFGFYFLLLFGMLVCLVISRHGGQRFCSIWEVI